MTRKRAKSILQEHVQEDTFIVQLTMGQLLDTLRKEFPVLDKPAEKEAPVEEPPKDGPTFMGRLLYGIAGIEDFFNVSHKTAWEWKDTWLKPAVKQRGRKIVVDAEYAVKLFSLQEKRKPRGKK